PAPLAVAADKPAAPVNRGEQMLNAARTLYKSGNYPAARQMAEQAKAGKLGVDAQADEMLAQISLAEQGGAPNLYESALDEVRKGNKGDVARARSLLSEVLAAGEGIDDGLRQRAESLLEKLSKDETGKAVASDRPSPGDDADALNAQKLNAEVG